MTTARQFEVGKTYSTRSACDYECVFAFTVKSRTAKFLVLEDRHGQVRRVGVRVWSGVESCKPLGSYSMCPVLNADKVAA
jgi:hypothetical protein